MRVTSYVWLYVYNTVIRALSSLPSKQMQKAMYGRIEQIVERGEL